MKRVRTSLTVTALLASLALAPGPAAGQPGGGVLVWDSIGVTPDSQIVYLHTRSVDRTSETALRVWTRTRSRRTREFHGIEYDRILLQAEYDCDGEGVRFLWLNLYREQRLVDSGRPDERSAPVDAKGYAEMLRRATCEESGPDPG